MMNILLQIWRWLFSLLRRGRYEREMEEEMRFHIEMQIEQNLASRMLNMAVLTPMLSARVKTAINAKPGFFTNIRAPKRRS